jgi:hypothetical protein
MRLKMPGTIGTIGTIAVLVTGWFDPDSFRRGYSLGNAQATYAALPQALL